MDEDESYQEYPYCNDDDAEALVGDIREKMERVALIGESHLLDDMLLDLVLLIQDRRSSERNAKEISELKRMFDAPSYDGGDSK